MNPVRCDCRLALSRDRMPAELRRFPFENSARGAISNFFRLEECPGPRPGRRYFATTNRADLYPRTWATAARLVWVQHIFPLLIMKMYALCKLVLAHTFSIFGHRVCCCCVIDVPCSHGLVRATVPCAGSSAARFPGRRPGIGAIRISRSLSAVRLPAEYCPAMAHRCGH